jgi:hypothetical protein
MHKSILDRSMCLSYVFRLAEYNVYSFCALLRTGDLNSKCPRHLRGEILEPLENAAQYQYAIEVNFEYYNSEYYFISLLFQALQARSRLVWSAILLIESSF